jgi:hypothetical protein
MKVSPFIGLFLIPRWVMVWLNLKIQRDRL